MLFCIFPIFTVSDFNTPFVPPGAAKAAGFTPNEEAISMLSAMGFNREQAIKALKNTVSIDMNFLIIHNKLVIWNGIRVYQ